ncbi:unnamed protein product, partial [Prorocentrum cordatum]
VPVLASRVGRAIGARGLDVRSVLAAAPGGVDLSQWLEVCRIWQVPLSQAEARSLHAELARGAGACVRPEDLEAAINRAAVQGVPEERWARELVSGCVRQAMQGGRPMPETALSSRGDAVIEEELRAALGQGGGISNEQWAQLRLLVERRIDDGLVLWRPFLKWACAGPAALGVAAGEVCKRLIEAMHRQASSVDQVFDALAKGKSEVLWPDFRELFMRLEPRLSDQDLQTLWQTFDKNGDGGVSRDEFQRAIDTISGVADSAMQDLCDRIRVSLERQGSTVDSLFNVLAGDGGEVRYPDFRALFAKMEQSLTDQQLEQIWQAFDKDSSGSVSREEFHRAERLPGGDLWAAMHKVRPALHAQKMFLSTAFESWAGSAEALLQEAQLRAGLAALGCGVTDAEVRAMFEKMASDPQAGATLGEFEGLFNNASGGEGFDGYARKVIESIGREALNQKGGSFAEAFQLLDSFGESKFSDMEWALIVPNFGDLNMTGPQQDRLWEIVCEASGHQKRSIDVVDFERLWGPDRPFGRRTVVVQPPPAQAPAGSARSAEDAHGAVEGALRARDMQQAISILLKMACMHAQLLRDLAASEWVCLVIPTLSFLVVAGRGAGKMYAEAAAIAAAKPHLGPPHLYIARGVFKSMVESEKLQKSGTQAYQTLVLFYEKFVSISSAAELGLVIRHFRLKKCYNEEYTRLQFAIGGDVTVQLADAQEGSPERHLSKLEVEQSIIKLAQLEDAKLKLGTAPQGHLETMAQRILDKTKQKGKGKGAK